MRAHILSTVVAAAAVLGFAVSAASCTEDTGAKAGTGPCTSGICGTGDGGSGAGMGNGGSGPGSGGSGGGPPICAWLCTPWDTQGNGDDATRTCLDVDGCADPSLKPPETVSLPHLDEDYYRCQVEPILDKLCSQLACHGTEPDIANGDPGRALRVYHRGRLRPTGFMIAGSPGCSSSAPKPSENCIGCIECGCWYSPHLPVEWQRNFDAARGFALDQQAQPLADMHDSEMLSQPEKGGGLPHAGIKVWDSANGDYQTILDWLNGAQNGSPCNSTN